MADIIQLRRDTAANWVTANPVLHDGEIGIETDTRKRKCGNGTTAWNSLPYMYSDDLDQEPTANSHKPVESGGAKAAIDAAAEIGLAALDAIGDADNVPTEESTELVRSGGVWESIRNNGKGAFDISAYKAVGGVLAKFDDLAQALGTNGANVPAAARKPGMSVCFVLNSDNKYVQYRLMSQTFSTTESDWQGVDEEPTGGSDNLVKSGGISRKIQDVAIEQGVIVWEEGSIDVTNQDNLGNDVVFAGRARSTFIAIESLRYINANGSNIYVLYDSSKNYIGHIDNVNVIKTSTDFISEYPSAAYLRVVEKNAANVGRWEYGIVGSIGNTLLLDFIIVPKDNEVTLNGHDVTIPYSHVYIRNNQGKYNRFLTANEDTIYSVPANSALVMSSIDGTISVVEVSNIDLSKYIVFAVYVNSRMWLHPSLQAGVDNVRIGYIESDLVTFKRVLDSECQFTSLLNNRELIWETGTITNGEDATNNDRKRTIGYIPIDNLKYLTSRGSNFVVLYAADYSCVNTGITNWTNLTKDTILTTTPSTKYIRIVKKSLDPSDIRIHIDIEKNDKIEVIQKNIISAIPTNGEWVDIASGLSDIQNVVPGTDYFNVNRTDRISAVDGMFEPILSANDLSIKVKVNSGYRVYINIYDDVVDESYYSGTNKIFNNMHLLGEGWLDGGAWHEIDLSNINTGKCAICFSFRGGSTISVSDYSNVGFEAKVYRYTSIAKGGQGDTEMFPSSKYLPLLTSLKRTACNVDGSGGPYTSYSTLSLAVISDIHVKSDIAKSRKIVDNFTAFIEQYSNFIDNGIILGDIAYNTWQSYDSYIDSVDGYNRVLKVVGNHDVYDYTGQADPYPQESEWATMEQTYGRYMGDNIQMWGDVSNPITYTANQTYYYKDYVKANVRLIVVDCMHWDNSQKTWLENALASTIDPNDHANNKHVIIAAHIVSGDNNMSEYDLMDCNFTFKDLKDRGGISPGHHNNYYLAPIVDAFQNDGGTFICYMYGHTHIEACGVYADYPNQPFIIFPSGTAAFENWKDTALIEGTTFENQFTVFSVDTRLKYIRMLRVGAEFDRNLVHKGSIVISYDTNDIKVVSQY